MKKILWSALLIGSTIFANAAQYHVHMADDGSRPTNRSLTSTPNVLYESSTNELFVRFNVPNDSFTVQVLNSAGEQIVQAMVAADGTMQTYLLPNLEQGSYTITLEGKTASYKGTLVLSER